MKYLKKIIVEARFFICSLRGFWSFNLGDRVEFQSKIYSINNGTCKPYWDLIPADPYLDGREVILVHESRLKKVKNWRNYFNGFLGLEDFYHTNWFDIMMNQPVWKIPFKWIP